MLLETWPRYWQKGRVKRRQNSLHVYPCLKTAKWYNCSWFVHFEKYVTCGREVVRGTSFWPKLFSACNLLFIRHINLRSPWMQRRIYRGRILRWCPIAFCLLVHSIRWVLVKSFNDSSVRIRLSTSGKKNTVGKKCFLPIHEHYLEHLLDWSVTANVRHGLYTVLYQFQCKINTVTM